MVVERHFCLDPCPATEGGQGGQGAQEEEVRLPPGVQALRQQPVGRQLSLAAAPQQQQPHRSPVLLKTHFMRNK